ncbi:hypothetical protein F3157_19905 [Virgibacillus dakarensis]|uniref:Uncharacterized protein n=1 Tax=Lentibacillus populi TaxID=1827502 RepID=A0A9W5X7D9_9BACI|nr:MULTISPECIES: hypothetical protein [Bacillaceae]MBT2216973.1 hypothetical protein [Virgibacillus dakarensis]MTW87885.1 hypothetical protein [Virgibacillus dakarensis]GGB58801.1 hypothetical protein GCM10011409_40340 [Lentibacillus populi]
MMNEVNEDTVFGLAGIAANTNKTDFPEYHLISDATKIEHKLRTKKLIYHNVH